MYLIDEVEELRDVVGDGGNVGVQPLQMLLVDLAHALHALVHALVVAVSAEKTTNFHGPNNVYENYFLNSPNQGRSLNLSLYSGDLSSSYRLSLGQ